MPQPVPRPFDLLVIGGGVNGAAIARDAAGRGLSVCLAERGDLGGGTSSASSKLFHGGLRYLEYFEFRLVRESLAERSVLLAQMPHIAWPMRFVLPIDPEMRFPGDTPAARILGRLMPWLRGRRPAWMIRAALALYDRMGGPSGLPGTRRLDLRDDPAGEGLRGDLVRAFEYSDVWVDDSRLVVLLARDAAGRGARVATRTEVASAEARDGFWHVVLRPAEGVGETVVARALVNAAGPWAEHVARVVLGQNAAPPLRLVRGSHIVVHRLFAHDRAYFLQGPDGRIVFLLPFEQDFTLIGTTEEPHEGDPGSARCTEAERDYLLGFANRYLARPLGEADVLHSFAGVRPLIDGGERSANAVSRDYRLEAVNPGAPLLHVLGGKITTHRKLAEAALARLAPVVPRMGGAWTARAPLPGGSLGRGGVWALAHLLRARYPFLTVPWAERLVRAYGSEVPDILGKARGVTDLGEDFGATLTAAEVRWMIAREFAQTAEDVLWRRSKLGLRLGAEGAAQLDAWMRSQGGAAPRPRLAGPPPGVFRPR